MHKNIFQGLSVRKNEVTPMIYTSFGMLLFWNFLFFFRHFCYSTRQYSRVQYVFCGCWNVWMCVRTCTLYTCIIVKNPQFSKWIFIFFFAFFSVCIFVWIPLERNDLSPRHFVRIFVCACIVCQISREKIGAEWNFKENCIKRCHAILISYEEMWMVKCQFFTSN